MGQACIPFIVSSLPPPRLCPTPAFTSLLGVDPFPFAAAAHVSKIRFHAFPALHLGLRRENHTSSSTVLSSTLSRPITSQFEASVRVQRAYLPWTMTTSGARWRTHSTTCATRSDDIIEVSERGGGGRISCARCRSSLSDQAVRISKDSLGRRPASQKTVLTG
jgi:hypothetical protein